MKYYAKRIAIFLITYTIISSFYLLVSPGINEHAIGLHMRRFIPATLACLAPYYLFPNFKLTNYITEAIVSIMWSITSPLLAFLAYRNTSNTLSYPYDVATGAYLFCSLVAIKILIQNYLTGKVHSILNIVHTILQYILIIIPICNICYYFLYSKPISNNTMLVIFQTNINEVYEYIGTIPLNISIPFIVLLITILIAMLINTSKNIFNIQLSKTKLLILSIIAVITTYYTFASLIPRTNIVRLTVDTQQYFSSIESYKTNRTAILDQLKVVSQNKLTTPHTIILVIGESATRNYMRAFNPDNNLEETTPWLSRQKDNFILYNNAYACAWNTVPALEHALTEANYYNDKEFNKSISIIDIAKRAGYKTYWFSNQAKIGVHDTPITLVAETADVSSWGGIGSAYDEGLLPHLKSVNKHENNFIILHLMGSHIDYDKRYPKQYQIWTDPNTTGRLADYKNSLVYTDKVLQDFFEYSKNNLNLASFIYFSDHGTDPNRSRDPDETKFIGLRIPLFLYLSPEYQSQNISEAKALKANKEHFFSNDLIYNLICGVLVVESNYFEPTESLASPAYKFNINNTKAGLGSKSVKDDPYL